MKKRIVALLLCCVMLLTLSPSLIATATADDETAPAQTEVTVSPAKANLPQNKKVTLTAQAKDAKSYQWQIMAEDDLWVDISGETERTIHVSYAMVASLLDGNKAQLRCKTDLGTTDPATITVTEAQAVTAAPAKAAPKAGTVTKEAEAIGEAVVQDGESDVVNDETVTPGETTGDERDTYTIVINYVFAGGKQAAPSWSATVATGSTYVQDIQSPVVVGYTPSDPVVHVETSEAKTYTVTYQPAEVEFTVKHYQQNVSNDQYTLVDTETKKGYTEAAVGESLATTYEGFYSLLYDTTTKIAADGSTVVEIKYDRYYYLMNFDLDGGYGVEPIYARYGAPISVGEPTKPGYTFNGWDQEIPKTMPAENTTFKANWKIGESGFTVVFWYENANDDGYSVAGTYKPADVAPGTTKSSDDYKNQNFTGRDNDHFTYNADMAETVTVKGDGSTVLNVYYTRNTYTLKFPGVDAGVLTCGKVEHDHSHDQCCTKTGWHIHGYGVIGSCNSGKCPVGYEHTHNSDCYSLVITAKYDSDITSVWKTDPIKSLLDQGYVFKSSVTDKYYSFLEKMPGQDITMTKTQWSGSTYEWYYYLEVPSGMSAPAGATTKTDGGKTYYLYHTTTIKGNRISLTYDEDYYPITGFTQRDKSVPSFNNDRKAYLYYTRNAYELRFINYGTTVKTATKYYQADISNEGFTPAYPDTLEANAYAFDGWYTDPFFSESGKFDFTDATMPAGPMVLYAHWVPVNHNVNIYSTDEMTEEQKIGETQVVKHGEKATEPAEPKNPYSDQYKFVGWFYKTDDPTPVEKAFDFSMPVNRDLNLYAKWSSNTLMEYTIRYKLEDGTEIAPPTTGSALAGTTKTFDAKTGTQLNEGYQSGYFPKVSSHSLTIDIADTSKNEFTFIYVKMPEVVYTVKYLEKGTNNQLADPKTVTTSDAVVTETFKQINGYAPDAYQKQLVLAAEGNEIIFWYVKDAVHAPVHIVHWIQNIAGDDYTEYQSSTNLNGVIGTKYSETPLTIDGFRYNGTKSSAEGTLTEAGLVLNLYYDRIEYPYEFRFLEQGTDNVLADPVTGNARYQAQVTQTAKDIPGYTLVGSENQAINIAIEDPANAANKNVKIFYYTEQTVDIKYEVVGPTGCGTLDNYQDNGVRVITGTPKGSEPAATDGFKFVGWFTDKDCTVPVNGSWVANNKLTPGKTAKYGDKDGYAAAIYYAKFEYDITDLTIIKTYNNMLDPNQSAVFTVTGDGTSIDVVIHGNGRVVIKGLKVGTTYTVTEKAGWTWRYGQNSERIELKADGNTITFTNTLNNNKWLTGGAWCDNSWATSASTKSTSPNYSGK